MLVVAKIGGGSLDSIENVARDIKSLREGSKLILVHGGGQQVSSTAKDLGIEPKFVTSPDGFRSRYTDRETLEVYAMVMAGRINKETVSLLRKSGVNALGVSGVDGGLIQAERKTKLIAVDERGRKRVIDGGYTGRIVNVNTEILSLLLEKNYVPVVAPLAIGREFELLNVDGDRTASSIAAAMKADLLVFMTNVEGLTLDGKIVGQLTVGQAKSSLSKIGPGMITKVHAGIEALANGVSRCVISSARHPSPLSNATTGKTGTVITPE